MAKRVYTVALCLLVAGAFATSAAEKSIWRGDGERINLVYGPDSVVISAGDPCWIAHGWGGSVAPGDNSDYVHDYGTVLNGGSYFEFYINGVPVQLKRVNTLIVGDTPGSHYQVYQWVIQFPAGWFAPGEYVLTGVSGCRNPKSAINSAYELPATYTVLLTVEL